MFSSQGKVVYNAVQRLTARRVDAVANVASRMFPIIGLTGAYHSQAAGSASANNNLVFLGAPGVGKGTFAARVATKLNIPAISTGDIIRAEIKKGSDLGKKIRSFSDSGKLVPDEIVTEMVKVRLAEPDAQRGYILDGYPRTVQQAKDLDGFQTVGRVINITLPQHVLMQKMLARRVCADCGKGYNLADINEGDLVMPPLLPKPSDCDKCHGKPRLVTRDDDKEEIVKERFVIYEKQTAPLIEYYSKQGKLQDFAVKRGLDDTPRLFNDLGV